MGAPKRCLVGDSALQAAPLYIVNWQNGNSQRVHYRRRCPTEGVPYRGTTTVLELVIQGIKILELILLGFYSRTKTSQHFTIRAKDTFIFDVSDKPSSEMTKCVGNKRL